MRHILALSGGKDSTALAIGMRQREPEVSLEYVCTPTGDELPEMEQHWKNLECVTGKPIHHIEGPGLKEVIRDEVMLPNWRARWCTRILKIQRFEAYALKARPCTIYVGLRADEESREGGRWDDIEGVELRFPLREWGWGIAEVRGYLDQAGIIIPARTDCARCFYQRLSEWWRLWKEYPEIFADAEEDERWVSEQRGKPCTYRSETKDNWPGALKELRKEFERGRMPKNRQGIPASQLELFSYDRDAMCSFCAR